MKQDRREEVIKHLDMLQHVITRMAHNSFLIKGWSLTLLIALAALPYQTSFYLPLLFIVLAFWGLDGYFLHQERLYRALYDRTRNQSDTNFAMDTQALKKTVLLRRALFSRTLILFYAVVEGAFCVLIVLFRV